MNVLHNQINLVLGLITNILTNLNQHNHTIGVLQISTAKWIKEEIKLPIQPHSPLNEKLEVSSMLIIFISLLLSQKSMLDAYQLLEFFSHPQSMANIINDCRQNLGYNLIINWRKKDKGKIKIIEDGIIMI
jgi:hypothetical protein